MYCPKCGAEMPDGAGFCGSCGAKLDKSRIAAQDPAPDAAAPAAAAAVAAKKSRMPLIIGGAAVAVAVIVGAVVYFMAFAPYNIDEGTFPDSAVRSALSSQADTDHDGKISRDEAKLLTSLDLSGSGVGSLEGLDKFPNLASLNLSNTGSLQQADFSQVKGVANLNISGSALTAADVSMLEGLRELDADGAAITALDVSHNAKLAKLSVDDAVTVSGVDQTGVRAQYLMVEAYEEYAALGYDMNGVGGSLSDITYEYSYNDDCTLANYVATSTAGYDNSEYTSGKRFTYENGRVVASEAYRSTYSADADITYNDKGMVEEVYSTSGSGRSSYSGRDMFEYDDSGKLVERVLSTSSSTSTYSYRYNDAGQLTVVESEYGYGSSVYESEFSYDGAGRVTSAKNEYQEFEFEYNDAGQLVKKGAYFLSDGKRLSGGSVVTFSYDQAGRLESATRTSGESPYVNTVTAHVTYDDNGLPTVVDRSQHIDSSGKSYDYSGVTTFEYTRVFTAKDAPDVKMPMAMGDPTTHTYGTLPLQFDVLGADKQDPIAYYTCTESLTQSSVVI